MNWFISVKPLNLKYNKLKKNRSNGNDWGDNEKILIDIDGIWVYDISEMDNRMCNDSKWIIEGLMPWEVLRGS